MPWMAPAAASHGWRVAEGGAAVWPTSGAERRRRPWTAGDGAQRSVRHGWREKQASHGWRGRQSEHGLKDPHGHTPASRVEGPPTAATSFASTRTICFILRGCGVCGNTGPSCVFFASFASR